MCLQILKIVIDILIISIDILILMKPMKIPPEIFTKIIPSPNSFVSDIQKFPLPEPAKTKSPSPQPLKKFLSHLTPNITDIDKIILLPTPSEALLKSLLKCPEIGQSQSFICEHLHDHKGFRMPLWTIEYWLEVLKIHSIKLRWASAQRNLDFLQKEYLLTSNNITHLINKVSSVLSKLSWKNEIKGFPAQIPPEYLTSYLTQNWLSDEHENQMLHLLQKELALQNPESSTNISDIHFFQVLSQLHWEGIYDEYEGGAWV